MTLFFRLDWIERIHESFLEELEGSEDEESDSENDEKQNKRKQSNVLNTTEKKSKLEM